MCGILETSSSGSSQVVFAVSADSDVDDDWVPEEWAPRVPELEQNIMKASNPGIVKAKKKLSVLERLGEIAEIRQVGVIP